MGYSSFISVQPKISMSILQKGYDTLSKKAASDLKGDAVSKLLEDLILESLKFLEEKCKRLELTSSVSDKQYCAFQIKGNTSNFSRPVNSGLFDATLTRRLLKRLTNADLRTIDANDRARALYTAAISYPSATDILKKDDRKTPSKFFEDLVGHLVSKALAVNPEKKIKVLAEVAPLIPGQDSPKPEQTLPTDFVFDLGPNKSRIHLPVKMSTRERVIQVWAHQRVLDGVYGINRFKGILVCLTETNMKRKDMSVVEVCLPDQWAIYQMFIAQLFRIYYFDPPVAYAPLANRYPFIQVKHFSSFFDELEKASTGLEG